MEFLDSEFNEILETRVGNDPKSEHCRIGSVINDRCDYNLDPEYQRGSVWNDFARSQLILSILQNVCIPSIIVSKGDDVYDVIDGKQRLTTLFNYIDNKFPLIWNSKNIYYSESPNEKDFVLSKNQKKKLEKKSLVFCVYDNLDIEKQRTIFEKINYGEDLTPGERLKGSNNKNVPVLNKLREENAAKLNNLVDCFKDKRDSQYLLISAICAILTDNESYGSVGNPVYKWVTNNDTNLVKEYEKLSRSFVSILGKLEYIKEKVFDYIKTRKSRSLKMLKRADYLMFIYALNKNPDCSKELIQFSKYLFHVDKETCNIYSKQNMSYLEYKKIGAHGTNNSFYNDKYTAMMKILSEIRKKNNFSDEDRAQIFGKTFGNDSIKLCKICEEDPITIRNFDAAHIISRNNGGIRHFKNFIATCRNCNLKMATTDLDIYIKEKKNKSLEELNIGV